MRDKLKNEKYFKEQLEVINIDIEIDSDTSDGEIPNWIGLYISYFAKLMTKYSVGENIENLHEDFINLVEAFKKSYTEDTSYNKILNTLSLSIIFNKGIIKELSDIIKTNEYYNDFIIQFFMNSDKYKEGKIEWEDMLLVKDIIMNTNDKKYCQNTMKNYLNNWYSNNKDTYWYDRHNKPSGYFGYWCLEAAALTYLLDLDDSEYLDNQYYPKDLVKYARNNKAV